MKEVLSLFLRASAGTGLNMFIGLIRNKIIASYLGPSGLGLISMLQQLQATLMPVATLGGDAPLVQGLACRSNSKRSSFLVAATTALMCSWLCCGVVLFLFGESLGQLIVNDTSLIQPRLVSLMSIPILSSAISSFLIAILTSIGAVSAVQFAQIIGNLVGLCTAIPMVAYWQSGGGIPVVLFLTSIPIASILFSAISISRRPAAAALISAFRLSAFQWDELRSFLEFGSVTVLTGLITTSTWLFIRREILLQLGEESLGLFTATVSLSGLSLSLLSTALMSFYLPRFSAVDAGKKRELLRSVFFIVLIVAILFFVALQICSEQFIRILFSEKFLPMTSLLRWWVGGDTLRSISYVFAIPVFSGRHLRFALFSEVIFSVGLLVGSYFAINISGNLVSLGYVYCITYCCYLLTTWIFAKSNDYA
jgi:O-antigen/teichoic acid export membrane protein